MTSVPLRSFGAKKKGQTQKDKKDEAKQQVKSEFEGKELDDVKKDYAQALLDCSELLDEQLSSIKSGRADIRIFDDLEVKAYGEMAPFQDVAQTLV